MLLKLKTRGRLLGSAATDSCQMRKAVEVASPVYMNMGCLQLFSDYTDDPFAAWVAGSSKQDLTCHEECHKTEAS